MILNIWLNFDDMIYCMNYEICQLLWFCFCDLLAWEYFSSIHVNLCLIINRIWDLHGIFRVSFSIWFWIHVYAWIALVFFSMPKLWIHVLLNYLALNHYIISVWFWYIWFWNKKKFKKLSFSVFYCIIKTTLFWIISESIKQ